MGKAQVLAMVLCHSRAALLERVLRHAQEFPSVHILAVPDRPTAAVSEVLARFPDIQIVSAPIPVMSAQQGQNWTTVRNAALDAFDAAGYEAAWEANFDDDRWFDPEAIPDLVGMMANADIWCIRAVSLFHWNQAGDVNVRQIHDEPLFGRYQRGDRRDPRFHSQVSMRTLEHVQRRPDSSVYASHYLHDWGSADEAERHRAFREYANAGKLSNYTRRYVQPPVLMSVEEIQHRFQHPRDFSVWQHRAHSPYEE